MSDWWARKLGNPNPQPQTYTPPSRPLAPVPFTPPQTPGYRTPVSYDPQQDYVTTKAQQSNLNQTPCPSCASPNYMKLGPSANAPYRCFDCGYPTIQSTSGLGGRFTDPSAGPVQAAQQISTTNNFNPANIQGHIG